VGALEKPGVLGPGHGGAAAGELPPLLRGMLNGQAATGLPPAWLPHNETLGKDDDRGDLS